MVAVSALVATASFVGANAAAIGAATGVYGAVKQGEAVDAQKEAIKDQKKEIQAQKNIALGKRKQSIDLMREQTTNSGNFSTLKTGSGVGLKSATSMATGGELG